MGEEKKWKQYVEEMLRNSIHKVVLSHPKTKGEIYKKISIQKKNAFFQIEKFTDKQVFHENIQPEDLLVRCLELIDGHYLQVNAWTEDMEYALLISKKDSCTMKKIPQKKKEQKKEQKACCSTGNCTANSHNRKKQYLLEEGTVIAPLVDMGIFTKEGKVVRTMYDKYRQINRFIELIDDAVRDLDAKTLHGTL